MRTSKFQKLFGKWLAILLLAVLIDVPGSIDAQSAWRYRNPVEAKNLADPSVIYGGDHWFYVYATGNGEQNLPVYKSHDLVTWQLAGDAFTDAGRPSFVSGGGLWAPEIAYVNGQYVLYYAMSTWGGEWACGIGVATSPTPVGPFTDHGKLFISSEIGVQNSIDPCHFTDDDGKQYLIWGSFRGIYGIELDETGLKIKEGATKFQIAPGSNTVYNTEASMVMKRGKYYYLFGSSGTCCEGAASTYHVVVARATNIKGPYVNKAGRKVMIYAFETILSKSDRIVGPGHNSELIEDDNGDWWMLYHGWNLSNLDAGRELFLDQVKWDSDGWPYIENGQPSSRAQAPYFSTYVNTDIANIHTDDNLQIVNHGDNNITFLSKNNIFYSWEILDLNGKVIRQGQGQHTKNLWLGNLKNGVYIISLKSAQGNEVQKFVKN